MPDERDLEKQRTRGKREAWDVEAGAQLQAAAETLISSTKELTCWWQNSNLKSVEGINFIANQKKQNSSFWDKTLNKVFHIWSPSFQLLLLKIPCLFPPLLVTLNGKSKFYLFCWDKLWLWPRMVGPIKMRQFLKSPVLNLLELKSKLHVTQSTSQEFSKLLSSSQFIFQWSSWKEEMLVNIPFYQLQIS